MSGDAIFPFPEPDFLWIHDIYLAAPVEDVDERGKVKQMFPALGTLTPIKGYLTAGDPSKDTTGFVDRNQMSAVCLVPRSIVVQDTWLLYSEDAQLAPMLAGVWKIETLRPNISHTRVLLFRNLKQWNEIQVQETV